MGVGWQGELGVGGGGSWGRQVFFSERLCQITPKSKGLSSWVAGKGPQLQEKRRA